MAWRWIASVSLSVPSMSNSKASSPSNPKRTAEAVNEASSGIDRQSQAPPAQTRRVERRADRGAMARRDQAVVGGIEQQLLAEGLENELAALKYSARIGQVHRLAGWILKPPADHLHDRRQLPAGVGEDAPCGLVALRRRPSDEARQGGDAVTLECGLGVDVGADVQIVFQ